MYIHAQFAACLFVVETRKSFKSLDATPMDVERRQNPTQKDVFKKSVEISFRKKHSVILSRLPKNNVRFSYHRQSLCSSC